MLNSKDLNTIVKDRPKRLAEKFIEEYLKPKAMEGYYETKVIYEDNSWMYDAIEYIKKNELFKVKVEYIYQKEPFTAQKSKYAAYVSWWS